jgi:GMC oxidoreductase/NAD(P)-binding Rossmann-like domain
MSYTNNENKLRTLLLIYSFLFFFGSVFAYYFFVFNSRSTSILLLSIPPLCLILSIFSFISSKGIRKNLVFVDLLNLSLFFTFIVSLIAFLKFNSISDYYLVSAIISLLLFVVIVLIWRKAIINRFDLQELSPTAALAYRALAEVVIGNYKAEEYSFDTIVTGFDNYLSKFKSSQKTSVKMVYVVMQYFPILYLNPPLSWMGIEDRENFIKKRFLNAGGLLLTLMRSAKQLVYFIYYGNKPSFKSTGYVMFEDRERYKEMPKKPDPELLNITYIRSDKEIQTDICVIGSGAAGAVAAYNLAKNTGKKVTIIEKGKYHIPQKDFTNIEPEMIGTLYKDGALEMTQDFDLAVLQGICVGGSTAINNGICFRTPHSVLEEWEKHGAVLDINKLENYFSTVEKIIGAQPLSNYNPPITNEGANRFFKGAEKLGLNPKWFVTNFGECGGSGYCNIGCKYNRKLSMLLNYLPMAQKEGVEIIADAGVEIIETDGNKVTKIRCKISDGISFSLKANQFVLAAGAISSSSILLKSGIKKNVGTCLSFNLTTPMLAEFPDVINAFDGVQMCCYIKGDGYLVETTHNPPGATALVMQGWFEKLNERMQNYSHYTTAAPVVGSKPNGKIKKTIFGNTIIDYDMCPSDFAKMKEGMKTLCRVYLAAGANYVLPSTYDDIVIKSESDIAMIDNKIIKHQDISLSSAHPQGGNPISKNENFGAVDLNFRVQGFQNLYVCDASIFPTGVMVNPQLSIMGIANYAADIISENI